MTFECLLIYSYVKESRRRILLTVNQQHNYGNMLERENKNIRRFLLSTNKNFLAVIQRDKFKYSYHNGPTF